MVERRKKRAAQAWALRIAGAVYEEVERRGGACALPLELPLEALPRNMAVRMLQEVGMAKNQMDTLRAPATRIAWSLRFGTSTGEGEARRISFVADRPFASRRLRASLSPMMGYAERLEMDFGGGAAAAPGKAPPASALSSTFASEEPAPSPEEGPSPEEWAEELDALLQNWLGAPDASPEEGASPEEDEDGQKDEDGRL